MNPDTGIHPREQMLLDRRRLVWSGKHRFWLGGAIHGFFSMYANSAG